MAPDFDLDADRTSDELDGLLRMVRGFAVTRAAIADLRARLQLVHDAWERAERAFAEWDHRAVQEI